MLENKEVIPDKQARIQNLIDNGVFPDLQSFTDAAITQFLTNFDHAKICAKKSQNSVCKFRVLCESFEDLIECLQKDGVKGHFNVTLIDFKRYDNGDYFMHHKKRGKLLQVYEVDIFEENKFFEDGSEYVYA